MDRFYFYSKSFDNYPGKGNGEIGNEDYLELNKHKNWRKVLSNFHVYPFIFEGKTYNTIEHAFQSKKISIVNQ